MAVTLDWLTGFEHGSLSTAGGGLFTTVTGAADIAIVAGAARSGGLGLRLAPATTTDAPAVVRTFANVGRRYGRMAVRVERLQVGEDGVANLCSFNVASYTPRPGVRINAAGRIQATTDGTAWTDGPLLVLNTWAVIEIALTVAVDPKTLYWRVDGVEQPAVPITTGSVNISGFRAGLAAAFGAATTYPIYHLDDVASGTYTVDTGEWLGNGKVLGLLPVASGPHNVGADTFRVTTNNGGAFTTLTNAETTSHGALDDWPPTADAAATDDWVDKSTGTTTTAYAQYGFADVAETSAPRAVSALAALQSTGTQANVCDLRLVEATTEHATKIYAASIGSASTVFKGVIYETKPTGGAWTTAALNDARIRFYSTDVAPIPRVKALLLEAEFPVAAVATTLIGTTRAVGYAVGARATAIRAATFAVRARRGATRALVYAVRTGTPAIARAASWAVRTKAAATRAASFAVRARASGTRVVGAAVRARVTATRAAAWTVGAKATATRALSWVVRAGTGQTRAVGYAVRASVLQTRLARFAVRARAATARALAYALRGRVAATRLTSWFVRARVTAARAAVWSVRGRATAARTVPYGVRAQASAARALVFAARARVGTARAAFYGVRAAVGAVRTAIFNVFTNAALTVVGTTRQALYRVRARVTGDRALAYGVSARVGAARPLVYGARTRSAVARTVAFNVLTNAALSAVGTARQVAYHARARVTTTRLAVYPVRTRLTTTRAVQHMARARVATSPRAISFALRGRVTSMRGVGFAIRARVMAARMLSYLVGGGAPWLAPGAVADGGGRTARRGRGALGSLVGGRAGAGRRGRGAAGALADGGVMVVTNPGEYTIAYYIMQAHGWVRIAFKWHDDGSWWQTWRKGESVMVVTSAADARRHTGATVGDEESWEG